MRVMVTGSRDWTDADLVAAELSAIGVTVLIHGEAPGLDTIAKAWGLAAGLQVIGIPAPWVLGRRAGPLRNGWLLDQRPERVVAFPLPGSRGTWDAVQQAKARGIPVHVIPDHLHAD